jgi:CoA:oxalate CoA-transferase
METEKAQVPPLKLAGIKVLDLSQYLAGPFCTMMLGDMGAEVLKVEPLDKGDPSRAVKTGGHTAGDSYFFLCTNRNKRSLTLDISKPKGQEIFKKLVQRSDVLVENFRPGVMEKLGLGYEQIKSLNTRLIYLGISGFGASGPYSRRPGFDQIAQGMSGLMTVTGDQSSGPMRVGIAIGDLLAGLFGANAVLLAIIARQHTQEGQKIETSILESLIGVLSWSAGIYFETGKNPTPSGNHHPLLSPYGMYEAKDGYINIAAGNDHICRRLLQALGLEKLMEEERFKTIAKRVENRQALTEILNSRLREKNQKEWVDSLNPLGVPTGPIYKLDQVFDDPQVNHLEMLAKIAHPTLGEIKMTGLPIKLEKNKGSIRLAPPLLGQHTEEALTQIGCSREEIEALRKEKIC